MVFSNSTDDESLQHQQPHTITTRAPPLVASTPPASPSRLRILPDVLRPPSTSGMVRARGRPRGRSRTRRTSRTRGIFRTAVYPIPIPTQTLPHKRRADAAPELFVPNGTPPSAPAILSTPLTGGGLRLRMKSHRATAVPPHSSPDPADTSHVHLPDGPDGTAAPNGTPHHAIQPAPKHNAPHAPAGLTTTTTEAAVVVGSDDDGSLTGSAVLEFLPAADSARPEVTTAVAGDAEADTDILMAGQTRPHHSPNVSAGTGHGTGLVQLAKLLTKVENKCGADLCDELITLMQTPNFDIRDYTHQFHDLRSYVAFIISGLTVV